MVVGHCIAFRTVLAVMPGEFRGQLQAHRPCSFAEALQGFVNLLLDFGGTLRKSVDRTLQLVVVFCRSSQHEPPKP